MMVGFLLETRFRRRLAVACLAFPLMLSVMVASAAPAAACGDVHCYGLGTTNFSAQTYQISSNQSWLCQSQPPPPPAVQTVIVSTMWAIRNFSLGLNWVEFGITSGPLSGGPGTYRDWYYARRSNNVTDGVWYGEDTPVAYQPNRNTSYVTTIRYDGANWRLFHGNTQIMLVTTPDIGYIGRADAGGELQNEDANESGKQLSLSRVEWGNQAILSGWPGITKSVNGASNPYTVSTVAVTSTSVTHYTVNSTPCD